MRGADALFDVSAAQAEHGRVRVLYYLAGLTCTEETFMIKAGAQRFAAELGLMLVAPDTSPRDTGIPGAKTDWDFGEGAGFYVDATVEPWSRHFRMFSYVTVELPDLVANHFTADRSREGIFGHSMGSHGALVCALRQPGRYKSVSAFAPVCAPSLVPWGQKAFTNYLRPDHSAWRAYDATELVRQHRLREKILIDQGGDDKFLDEQLRPDELEAACRESGQPSRFGLSRAMTTAITSSRLSSKITRGITPRRCAGLSRGAPLHSARLMRRLQHVCCSRP